MPTIVPGKRIVDHAHELHRLPADERAAATRYPTSTPYKPPSGMPISAMISVSLIACSPSVKITR